MLIAVGKDNTTSTAKLTDVDFKYWKKVVCSDNSQSSGFSHLIADGDELQHIMEKFGVFTTMGSNWQMTIPWNYKSKTQTWYGDIAKTILANL